MTTGPTRSWERLTYWMLAVFYYWVNFGPLTRGSAATGYAVLFAMAIATAVNLQPAIPEGVQVDWEAILRYSIQPYSHTAVHIQPYSRTALPPHVRSVSFEFIFYCNDRNGMGGVSPLIVASHLTDVA